MNWPTNWIVPLVLGVAMVLQATLNKSIAQHTGLATAVLLNMVVATCFAVGLAVWCRSRGEPAGVQRWPPELGAFAWWWVVPGLIGFAIVLGLPWAVQQHGALATFVALVFAQMVASALWDRFHADIPLTATRLLGAGCTVLGVWLLSRPIE